MNYTGLADRIIHGIDITESESLEFLEDSDELMLDMLAGSYKIRRTHFKNNVTIQLLKNAKSGNCSEDCSYCSQSSVSEAKIPVHPLVSSYDLIQGSDTARKIRAGRYCMALSGGSVTENDIDILCNTIKEIKNRGELDICCSLGFITRQQAQKPKAAGLNRVNHNLNTSPAYYSKICSSHTYNDRIENIRRCKEAGLEICSGGIIGQGESNQDIIDFFFELKKIDPQSIPLNFLIPMKGTPFEKMDTKLNPVKCLKILALARYIHPGREIRMAAGREYHLKTLQPLAFYAVNSIFVRGYLTSDGDTENDVLKMIHDSGFNFGIESSN